MYRAVTRQIEVTVEPNFMPERSSAENSRYFWSYTIVITNTGDETVQLRTRYWIITDASGRTLSGQVTEAFWNSVRHVRPLAVGLNCALGAADLRPYVAELSRLADTFVSTHPNAGLPNAFGEYDETPDQMAKVVGEFASSGIVNIVGGCCGTTPAHIEALAAAQLLRGMVLAANHPMLVVAAPFSPAELVPLLLGGILELVAPA